ncbi:MAG TPA: tetratricopeptide repeat protein [Phycisphaerales bacterium]|nr:tetratricopeptide repeat protein [Phycisphaerales bacterium]
MRFLSLLLPSALLCVIFLSGCNGPTSAGLKARSEAQQRLNIINAQVNYQQADNFFKTGQFDKAAREIRIAIERYPELGKYFVLQGRIQMEQHMLQDAQTSFNKAVEKDPKNAEAHYYAGIVYQRWSDDEQAYSNYKQALELDPNNISYVLATAESLIALGELDAAKQVVEPRLKYFENNAAMRQILGQVALLQNNPQEAVNQFTQARLDRPDDMALLEELMWAQYRAELYSACLESVTSLIDHTQNSRPDYSMMQARCLTHMGRQPEARNVYVRISRETPADPAVWSELGVLCWDMGDWNRLSSCGQRLITLQPDRYEGYLYSGLFEQQRGNTDKARELFEQAAKRDTDSALPHMILGQLLQNSGDLVAARSAYAKAVEIEPNNSDAKALYQQVSDQRVTNVPDSSE